MSNTTPPIVILLLLAIGCAPETTKHSAKEKPAKVELHPSEQDIYRVKLTEKAESRLQISTVPARMRNVQRSRSLGGDVVIPDGMRIPVTVPIPGRIQGIDNQKMPIAGQKVKAGQPLVKLTPILRPELEVPGAAERVQMADARVSLATAQIQADGDVSQARARVEAADIIVKREKRLLAGQAGSRQAVDDAEALHNIATQGLEAAIQRKKLLDQLKLETETGTAKDVIITAPSDGILQTVSSSFGQVVSVGSPLFEIVDLRLLWVRVPIYAGQLDDFALDQSASLRLLSDRTEDGTPLTRVDAPPSADSLASSVDVYFLLKNPDGRFLPGQRVLVDLPMKGEEESLVVPRASVLRDIHGIAWVYVKSGEHQFERARVTVEFTTEDDAVLRRGPKVGSEVVVDGAAELFGTEFGAGK